jgi:hypothetical protein
MITQPNDDQAYKQWLDTAQQFYKLPAIPAQSKPDARL